ncbi:Uncharacterized protein TCM_001318 [Theobroma cacao]|uniref:Uncharacterized protein n=1 Tax=Theobroma cacao TaxID=3641 RepID=A0A061DQY5_THECC|nr:Uncharacterized protein TCM_001318 [Theobroma cacao]
MCDWPPLLSGDRRLATLSLSTSSSHKRLTQNFSFLFSLLSPAVTKPKALYPFFLSSTAKISRRRQFRGSSATNKERERAGGKPTSKKRKGGRSGHLGSRRCEGERGLAKGKLWVPSLATAERKEIPQAVSG